jgi:predicted nucleotidyltransferase
MGTGPSLVDTLAASLNGYEGAVSAYLFGSEARGYPHRDSDVDVGVLLDRHVHPHAADRFEVRLRLIGCLQAAVGREVDIVILNDAPPQLVRHIMTGGHRLMLTDAAVDHAHLRTMLSRAADLEPFLRRTRALKAAGLAP